MSAIASVSPAPSRSGPKGLLWLSAGFLLLAALVCAVHFAGWFLSARRCHCGGLMTACNTNLRNIATACAMYADEHGGQYPTGLSTLCPEYLKASPTCPVSGEAYAYSLPGAGTKVLPARFYVFCRGESHRLERVKPDHPAFDSQLGLDRGQRPRGFWD